jgi:selenocysteine-specific elongation factor
MIIGTAGHIDHGKTALVRALTGVDTDRLPEEKRRGITIELGFAPLVLPGVGTAGIVDVPGHEAFVRTMLAGASGIDLALIVIAADEGVMPQTREHLAILDLLGLSSAVVALTKCDLADADWLALVRDDVHQLLAPTRFADAPIVETSSVTGAGLDRLIDALRSAMEGLVPRDAADLFRMPIDRVFTVKGTGTVITGTAWTGTIRRDATVRLLPNGGSARVRGLESHGSKLDAAHPGTRVAIALAGVDHTALDRGMVAVESPVWEPTTVLRADATLLDDAPEALRPRTRVRFHLGTVDVGARVVAAGGPIAPGTTRPVRVVLDEPVVARAGDRFVLRRTSPVETIGGGVVTDPAPPRRRARPWPEAGLPIERRAALVLAEAGGEGVEEGSLPIRLGVRPGALPELLRCLGTEVVRAGARLFARATRDHLAHALVAAVDAAHAGQPLEPGAPLQTVRAGVRERPELVDLVLRELVDGGVLEVAGGIIRRRGWTPRLTPAQETTRRELLATLRAAGAEPQSVQELAASAEGAATFFALLRILEREGVVVQVEPDRFYAADVVAELVGLLRNALQTGREYTPGELRDVLGVSRKYLIPFLEYCDRTGITERRAGGRVLGAAGRGSGSQGAGAGADGSSGGM